MNQVYEIEITGTVYNYADAEDGDRIELSSDTTTVVMDDNDAFLFADGDTPAHIVWAVDVIDNPARIVWAVDVIETPTDEWLSGSYTDPYQGEAKITETSVRLTGDWTDQDRAIVFQTITGKYHTA